MFFSKSRVERRIVRSFWNDGLLDILSGVVVLLIGISWRFDLVPLGAIAPVVVVPFWKPLRTWITEPRLGHVEFSENQTIRYRSFLIWSFLIGILTFTLATSLFFFVARAEGPVEPQHWVAAIPAWAFSVLAILTSLVILVRRFLGYAGLFFVLGVLVVVFDQRPEIAMLEGGVIVTIAGLLRLITFLHSHPQQPLEMNGA